MAPGTTWESKTSCPACCVILLFFSVQFGPLLQPPLLGPVFSVSVCLSVCLCFCLCLSLCPCLSASVSLCVSLCLRVSQSLPLSPSVCLSVCLPLSLNCWPRGPYIFFSPKFANFSRLFCFVFNSKTDSLDYSPNTYMKYHAYAPFTLQFNYKVFAIS